MKNGYHFYAKDNSRISVLDYYNYNSNNNRVKSCILDIKGKNLLRDLYIKGSSKITSEDYRINFKYSNLNMQYKIHQYILDTCGREEYEKNINYIHPFYRIPIDIKKHNINIITCIFLLAELLSVSKTNLLYDNDRNIRYDRKNISVSTLDYINQLLNYPVEDELKTLICEELIKERFNQIKRIIISNQYIPAQDESINHENTYQIYIIVKELDGNNLLYRCAIDNTINN